MLRAVATALLLLLAACGTTGSDEVELTAVATAYPLAWLVESVAPDAQVVSLAARGQDPHDLELTPQQRADLERADIAVYLGDIGFQPQVEAALASAAGTVVSAVDVLGEDRLRAIDGESGDDHTDEHAEEDVDDHGEESEMFDPHLWFDARLMAALVPAVVDAAAQADQGNAAAYRENGTRVAAQLEQVADDIAERLGSCRFDEVVVGHEAYQYLLAPHGMTEHGISGAGGHSEASPQDIGDLAAMVRDLGLPAVLSEPVEGRSDAEAVAAEAGVEVLDIYSLDIVDETQAAKGFPALLREQADAVATAAECGP